MVINLSSKECGFAPCNLIQEFFNRLLKFIVEQKGKEFDHVFIREVIARNLHHMARTKPNLREGVSLAKRSTRHSEPHTNPEVLILMQQYAHHEVHSRRRGRFIEENDIDNFSKGWSKLRKGKLRKWVDETTCARVSVDIATRISALHASEEPAFQPSSSNPPSTFTPVELATMTAEPSSDLEIDEDSDDSEDSDTEYFRNSTGTMEVIDGRLVAETLDMERTVEEAMAWLDEEFNREHTQGNDSCTDSDQDSDIDDLVRYATFLPAGMHY